MGWLSILVYCAGDGEVRPIVSLESADGASGSLAAASLAVAPAQSPAAAASAALVERAVAAASRQGLRGLVEARLEPDSDAREPELVSQPDFRAVLLATLALGRSPALASDGEPRRVAVRLAGEGSGETYAAGANAGEALGRAIELAGSRGRGAVLDDDPAWSATLAYLVPPRTPIAAARTADLGREDLVGEVFVGSDGLVCAARANAERAARPIVLRRFLAPGPARFWRTLALLRRGLPAGEIRTATGAAPWLLEELAQIAQAPHPASRAEFPTKQMVRMP